MFHLKKHHKMLFSTVHVTINTLTLKNSEKKS